MFRPKHTKLTNTSCSEPDSAYAKGSTDEEGTTAWTTRIQPLSTQYRAEEFCISLLHGEVFLISLSWGETVPVSELESSTDCGRT